MMVTLVKVHMSIECHTDNPPRNTQLALCSCSVYLCGYLECYNIWDHHKDNYSGNILASPVSLTDLMMKTLYAFCTGRELSLSTIVI